MKKFFLRTCFHGEWNKDIYMSYFLKSINELHNNYLTPHVLIKKQNKNMWLIFRCRKRDTDFFRSFKILPKSRQSKQKKILNQQRSPDLIVSQEIFHLVWSHRFFHWQAESPQLRGETLSLCVIQKKLVHWCIIHNFVIYHESEFDLLASCFVSRRRRIRTQLKKWTQFV